MTKQEQIPGTERPVIDEIDQKIEAVDDITKEIKRKQVDLGELQVELLKLVKEKSKGDYFSKSTRRHVVVKKGSDTLSLTKWIPKEEAEEE